MASKSYEMDMCSGPLPGKILRFAIPLMLSSILQLLFNAADVIVVGQFSGSTSLAAVGSTGALTNLLTNIFLGLSIGANVLVARYYGARQENDVRETIQTSMLIAIVGGLLLVVVGLAVTYPLLELMATPEDVIGKAATYMRIIFVGCPFMLVYNFGSAILRAVGDTKRPLYYLTAAGILNIILNLFFVIVCHLDVAGVALATIISQCLSMALVVRCLMKEEGALKFHPKEMRFHKEKLLGIVRIGLPAGLQGAVFSISNVLIQSTVNSFGSIAMAGNTAAANIEGFVYVAMNAMYQSAISFTGQNMGARKYRRVDKIRPPRVLHERPGGCRVRALTDGDYLPDLLHLRDYGHAGGEPPRDGLLGRPDDRVDRRGLRAAGAVDFHRFPVYLADADDPVHLLPGHLGGDGAGAPCDLPRHPAAVPVAGPRGPGDLLPERNCIKIRPRGEKRGLFACFFAEERL